MKKQNLQLKLLGSLTIGMSMLCFHNPIKAQEFYHFPASFFNPVAHTLESLDDPDIIRMLEQNNDFEIVSFLLKNDPTSITLEQQDVTFLAPTDKAFQALPSHIRTKLSQPGNLSKLLRYHTITKKIEDRDIRRRQVNTLLGNSVTITGFPIGSKYGVKMNNATASDPLPVRNGVVVPLDRVLIPPGF